MCKQLQVSCVFQLDHTSNRRLRGPFLGLPPPSNSFDACEAPIAPTVLPCGGYTPLRAYRPRRFARPYEMALVCRTAPQPALSSLRHLFISRVRPIEWSWSPSLRSSPCDASRRCWRNAYMHYQDVFAIMLRSYSRLYGASVRNSPCGWAQHVPLNAQFLVLGWGRCSLDADDVPTTRKDTRAAACKWRPGVTMSLWGVANSFPGTYGSHCQLVNWRHVVFLSRSRPQCDILATSFKNYNILCKYSSSRFLV